MIRKTLVSLGLAAAVGLAASSVGADPLLLPAASPLFLKYNNIEQVCTANCIGNTSASGATWTEGNWGLINVTTINVGTVVNLPPNNDIGNGSPTLFADGISAGHVTGIFYGIQIDANDPTKATGGTLDLYWHDGGPSFSVIDQLNGGLAAIAANRTAQDKYTGYTDGTFLVRLNFMPGVLPGSPTTTVSSTTNPATGTGAAFSYQDVDLTKVGPWTTALNGNWFLNDDFGNPLVAGSRDTRTQSNYTPGAGWNNLTAGIVGLKSEDPTRAFTIPEPTSMLLLGIGLLGAGLARRRSAA